MGNSPSSRKRKTRGESVCGSEHTVVSVGSFSSCDATSLHNESLNFGVHTFGDVIIEKGCSLSHNSRNTHASLHASIRGNRKEDPQTVLKSLHDLNSNCAQKDMHRENKNKENQGIQNRSPFKISRYYCGPCSTYVPKTKVILHEESENHRRCCNAWVLSPEKGIHAHLEMEETLTSTHFSRSHEVHENCKNDSDLEVNSRVNGVSSSMLENSGSMTKSAMNDDEILLQVVSIVEPHLHEIFRKYLSREECVQLKENGKYFCSQCNVDKNISDMLSHVVGKPHLLKSGVGSQKFSVLEEKEKILGHLLLMKGMFKRTIQQMFQGVCQGALKRVRNVRKTEVSGASFAPLSMQIGTSKTKSFLQHEEELHNRRELEERDCETSITPSLDIFRKQENTIASMSVDNRNKSHLKEMQSGIVALVSGSSGMKTIRSEEIVTEKEIFEAIDEYLSLEEVSSLDVSRNLYKCLLCNVHCSREDMFRHVLSKSHMNSSWATRQTSTTLNGKLELLAFFELLEYQKLHTFLSCTSAFSFTSAMSELRYLMNLTNVKKTTVQHTSKIECPIEALPFEEVSSVHPEYAILEKSNSSQTEERSLTEVEESNSTDIDKCNNTPIVIGESDSANIKEEFDQICAGTDTYDFELECEVCGSVFPIFNGDVEISVDMHVQNDPVHSLAVAVPVERNASSVAEMAEGTLNSPANIPRNPAKEMTFRDIREVVISKVFLLEQNYVVLVQNGYWCECCNVQVKTRIQMFRHLLSLEHLNEDWFNNLTYEVLQQKSKVLSSLIKHRYAVNDLWNAVGWIKQRSLAKLESSGQSNESQRVNSVVIKSSNVSGTKTLQKKSTLKCGVCEEDLGHLSKNMRKLHRRACTSRTFFCEVCKIKMALSCKDSHLSGKSHKSKITSVLENIASNLSSLQFGSGIVEENESQ